MLGTSAPLVLKVLGPTADYVGNELQSWTQRRLANVQRIFSKAEERLGDQLDEPGQVPPRVLKEVLEEGSYLDDELGAEYFGGLLAVSRSEVPIDDRAAALAALVGRLSTFQLRAHYVLYATAQKLLAGTEIELALASELEAKGRIFMPFTPLLIALGASKDSVEFDWNSVLQHSLVGLNREELVDDNYVLGQQDFLQKRRGLDFSSGGLIFRPTLFGIELFCSAHGVGKPLEAFIDPHLPFGVSMDFPLLLDGSTLLHEIPRQKKSPQ
jgi:hypothetical protein